MTGVRFSLPGPFGRVGHRQAPSPRKRVGRFTPGCGSSTLPPSSTETKPESVAPRLESGGPRKGARVQVPPSPPKIRHVSGRWGGPPLAFCGTSSRASSCSQRRRPCSLRQGVKSSRSLHRTGGDRECRSKIHGGVGHRKAPFFGKEATLKSRAGSTPVASATER